MSKKFLFIIAAIQAAAVCAAPKMSNDTKLRVTAENMSANVKTGDMQASGNVVAVAPPFKMMSDKVSRIGQTYHFSDPTLVTTCTNCSDCLHWSLTGTLTYEDGKEVTARNMTLRLFGMPVAWLPYWWQPLNTDYGWRVMPGYRSRWGAYLLTKYVYNISDNFFDSDWGLRGNTRLDLRTKNGVALGQGVRWKLGDFGEGKFKVYYLWDDDSNRYEKYWNNSSRWNYRNWNSTIPDERYSVGIEHRWEPTERDVVRLKGVYFSDSMFEYDFLRDSGMGLSNRYPSPSRNELAWEHLEDFIGITASVAGPVNDFYQGVNRLPEVTLDVIPVPLWSLPIVYESSTRIGWLNRNYAKYGDKTTSLPFKYYPGMWADYQAFRGDTYHRFSAPFKVADIVSVVPRFGVRGTYWSHSGAENLTGHGRANSTEEDVSRAIVEGGITFAARGVGYINQEWQHLVEPYLDVLLQEAEYYGLSKGSRALYFDSVDGSSDWLDQFAGRSRNLPYSWYGITPGVRNAFRKVAEDGSIKTIFDIDVYAAVQFNDTEWTQGNRYHKLTSDQSDPNYGRDGDVMVAPGFRARIYPADGSALMARVEWDGQNDTIAYADLAFKQEVSKTLSATIMYTARDHRLWDFASTPFDPTVLRNEDLNWAKHSYAGIELEHEICDAVAWGPFVRWDMRENDLDEVGAWLDLRTDCLAFRFSLAYENDYMRIDGSEDDHNWRFAMGIYLRALGSSMMFGD